MGTTDARPVVELKFQLTDDQYPFVRISDRERCRFELLEFHPRGQNRYAEYFSVTGTDPLAVKDRAGNADVVDSRLLAREDGTALFEFEVTDDCPVAELAVQEAIPRTATCEDGCATIGAEVVPPPDPAEIVDEYQNSHPDATLVEMVEADRTVPLFTRRELVETLEDRLTDRQLEVLRTAYEAGYYERPRETTGEAVAAGLDISVATFSQHIRVAERRILELLFESSIFDGDSR